MIDQHKPIVIVQPSLVSIHPQTAVGTQPAGGAERLQPIKQIPLFLMLSMLIMVAGCRSVLRPNIPLPIDLQNVIPSDWEPTEELRPMSIDGDADVEYMLLYRYDQGVAADGSPIPGPIGAVIYDLQIDSGPVLGPEPTELVPIPNQPAGFYVPYRILPNYWSATGNRYYVVPGAEFFPVGYYIAEPEDNERITTTPIQRDTSIVSEDVNTLYDEMIIYGGETHITSIWWENAYDGYGVAHLYAPGGFRNFIWEGVSGASPIQSVEGAFPLYDRSRLCRNFLYTRAKDEENDVKSPLTTITAARYVVSELGISFCDGTPIHPFYPEGVVLAYLLQPTTRTHLLINDKRTLAEIIDLVDFDKREDNNERIQNIRTQSIIPYPPRAEGGVQYNLETIVCVEFVSADNFRRQMDFVLRYLPPTLDKKETIRDITTDEMVIVDVIPQDMNEDDAVCWERIADSPSAP